MKICKMLIITSIASIASFLLGWSLSGNYRLNPYSVYTSGIVTGVSNKAVSGTTYFIEISDGETLSVQHKQYTAHSIPSVGDEVDLVLVWDESHTLLQVVNVCD